LLARDLIKEFVREEKRSSVQVLALRKGTISHMWPLKKSDKVKEDDEIYIRVLQR